jgi:uncharacterized protein YbjT (DUF2867 family)
MLRVSLLCALAACAAGAANRTVVVTGATGGTGSLTYLALKAQGMNVRGLVRNTTKAKALLKCTKCDESEGIFVGDVTKPDTLAAIMKGADTLVITTGGKPAKDMLFDSVENQVGAFLGAEGPPTKDRHAMLVSMAETTLADTLFNKILARLWGGWDVGFYSLQGETFLMNANVPFTIVKCCGLSNAEAGKQQLLVGHDDKGWSIKDSHEVPRADVANVLAAAAANPGESANLRFDFCSKDGQAQPVTQVFQDAMYPWDARKRQAETVI